MKRKLLCVMLASTFCLGVSAQPLDLVAASGASFKNNSGYISFSIGELFTATLTSPSALLTQGFQQTRLRKGVSVVGTSAINMSVYPNPVQDLLILHVEKPEGFDFLLYDSRGGLLLSGNVRDMRTEIDLSALVPAIYILRVTNYNEEVRLFQIVKY